MPTIYRPFQSGQAAPPRRCMCEQRYRHRAENPYPFSTERSPRARDRASPGRRLQRREPPPCSRARQAADVRVQALERADLARRCPSDFGTRCGAGAPIKDRQKDQRSRTLLWCVQAHSLRRRCRAARDGRSVERYFETFARFFFYEDVFRTLEQLSRRHRLAVVSNIHTARAPSGVALFRQQYGDHDEHRASEKALRGLQAIPDAGLPHRKPFAADADEAYEAK